MPYKDKEAKKEHNKKYGKEYRERNKEAITEYKKEYYDKNKDKKLEQSKEYYQNNKDKIKERQKEYSKEYRKTESRKKSNRIANWKSIGVISDDFNSLYEYYLNVEFCELCDVELVEGSYGNNKKCLDHDHITGEFRNVLCCWCNIIRG